jgi:hypothetical protein
MHTWEHISTFTSLFSFIGPRRNKKKFSIVRLLASRMLPLFECNVNSVSPNAENKWRTNVAILEGGLRNSAFEGCRRLVVASNLGAKQIFSRCYGRTTIQLTVVPYAEDTEQAQIIVDMTEEN